MSSYLIYEFIKIPSFILFLVVYIISFICVLSVDDWILIWLGLELNIISYLILIYKKYDILVIESCLKYFLIQSLGSVLFLSSFYSQTVLCILIILLLRYKLGAGPFFYWFPSVCSGLGWLACYVLITFQKVIPLFLISGFLNWIIWYVIILSLGLGVFGSINQVDIKSLFAFSSVHHLGWLISCMFRSDLFWFWYLLIYSLMLIGLIFYLIINDINNFYILGKCKDKVWFIIGFIRIGGLPPLLGFFLKWSAFLYILPINYTFIIFLLIISIIMLYIYIRVIYDSLIINNIVVGWHYQFDILIKLTKVDYLNFFGLFIGTLVGLILII
jgi:NADH:ubiquinone oxidoreductase subunit 2 (subunit N)